MNRPLANGSLTTGGVRPFGLGNNYFLSEFNELPQNLWPVKVDFPPQAERVLGMKFLWGNNSGDA